MKRTLLYVVSALLSMTVGTVSARAEVVQRWTRSTFSYSSVDIGCRQQDTIFLAGDVMTHEVDVNGDVHYENLTAGALTFTENGEHFSGHFSYPTSVLLKAGSPVATMTQAFSTAAQGDAGHVAVLHVTAHTTFVAAAGLVTVDFFILHQSCN